MDSPAKGVPEAAPTPDDRAAARPGAGTQAGGGQSKRRRGSRGGRRHKKPAVETAAVGNETSRDRAVEPPDALATLPTAPLVPVGEAAVVDRRGAGRTAVEAPAKAGDSRGGRRAKPSSGTPPADLVEGGQTPDVADAGTPATARGDASAVTAADDGRREEESAGKPPEDDPSAKRRRRGSRGGRHRHKNADIEHEEVTREAEEAAGDPEPGGEESGEVEPDTAADGADPRTSAPSTKSARRRHDDRRPKAIVRQDEGSGLGTPAPAEAAKRRQAVVAERPDRKIILVSDDGEELRVALVEDGRLSEVYIERPDRRSYLGDIYQGRVESVMSGIDAAFVDFGLEKNGFLYVDEVTTPEGEKRARRISDALKGGQQVLVQVIKDPMGHKGARLSTKISLAGRYLVYVPGGSGVGVSRRLKQSERERLRELSKELKPRNAGLIIRTIAEGHGLEDLKRDLRYLSRLWSRLKKKAETVKAPGLVHKEVDISLEVTRDLFNETCESLLVDDPRRHKAIVAFLDKEAPDLIPRVKLHTGDEPLFTAYGIEEQIARALERRVSLPSGGNLVIDHTEALTVIDVNTGRFTRGKGLEDTITKTNIEAAREVVRQLRLRDIGGIIIIDFIDMAHTRNRELVLATLEAELETDRTKTYVVELSPLGLVEMTRQNTTDGARGILTRSCPVCSGKGRVLSEETMALSVERRVRALARKSQAKAWLIEVNGGVADRLSGARLKRLEKLTGRRVFLEGAAALPVESFRVVSEGSLAHVQDQRIPVREGQEVTVELEFSLTYSPRDAVGYVDGYMIIVEGGRQHLGKRRRVRITETARTGARATVLKGSAAEAN